MHCGFVTADSSLEATTLPLISRRSVRWSDWPCWPELTDFAPPRRLIFSCRMRSLRKRNCRGRRPREAAQQWAPDKQVAALYGSEWGALDRRLLQLKQHSSARRFQGEPPMFNRSVEETPGAAEGSPDSRAKRSGCVSSSRCYDCAVPVKSEQGLQGQSVRDRETWNHSLGSGGAGHSGRAPRLGLHSPPRGQGFIFTLRSPAGLWLTGARPNLEHGLAAHPLCHQCRPTPRVTGKEFGQRPHSRT